MRNPDVGQFYPQLASLKIIHMLDGLKPGEEGPPLFSKLSTMLHSMISELHVATWHLEMLQQMADEGHLQYIVNIDQEDGALANIFSRVAESLHEVGYIAGHICDYGGREHARPDPLNGFHRIERRIWNLRSTVSMIVTFLNNNAELQDVWSPIELGVYAALESLGDLRHELQLADDHLQALIRQHGGLARSAEEAIASLSSIAPKTVSSQPSRTSKATRKATSPTTEEATA